MIDANDFKHFMRIDVFPEYDIEYYQLDNSAGFAYVGHARYDARSKKHTLLLPENLNVPRFLLFHEMTHIYDMHRYSKDDRNYDFFLTGYMEYHAAQVELMVMMGAENIDSKIAFSMKDIINNSEWSVQQYLDDKLDLAKKLVQEIEKQKRIDGLRAFFNFLGLKSICSMFATDFKDGYSYGEILERMSTFLLMEIRNEYSGWIFDIDRAVVLYSQAYAAVADN